MSGASLLPGADIAIVGRFDRFPRTRLARELERRGARLLPRLQTRAAALVVGHGAVAMVDDGGIAALLARARRDGAICLSENALLRCLGLGESLAQARRDLSLDDLARHAGIAAEELDVAALLDVIESDSERFEFRDLVIAREIARLRRQGASLGEVLAAAIQLRRRCGAAGLARARLVRLADGDLVEAVGEFVAETTGQLRLPLSDGGNPSLEHLFAAAETAEDVGDWPDAERLYRRFLSAVPRDVLARFNLANVLCELERYDEARLTLREAVAIDPLFAEAWLNLAHLAEAHGDRATARRCLASAVEVDPDYGDALYNLGRILFVEGAHQDAAPLFERFIALEPNSEWARKARRALALCRMSAAGLGGDERSRQGSRIEG